MLRIPTLAASLALIAGSLCGCALLDDVGDSDLDDALELVPGAATTVTFMNRLASAERLGIDDIESGDDTAEHERYINTFVDPEVDSDLVAVTQFTAYVVQMAGGAAFSELDIVWEADASTAESSMSIYKMHEDLDLDAVADDLVDVGYEEDEISGHRHLFLENIATNADLDEMGMLGDYPALRMPHVVVVPDEHLMYVTGSPASMELAVDVFEDDVDSATDDSGFDQVIEGADDPEIALLERGISCEKRENFLSPSRAKVRGLDELGTPDATGFFVAGEEAETSSVLAFTDDDAAQADLDARERYLADGLMLKSKEPIADLADWEIERDGNLVRIDYAYDNPATAFTAALALDGFHACNPD